MLWWYLPIKLFYCYFILIILALLWIVIQTFDRQDIWYVTSPKESTPTSWEPLYTPWFPQEVACRTLIQTSECTDAMVPYLKRVCIAGNLNWHSLLLIIPATMHILCELLLSWIAERTMTRQGPLPNKDTTRKYYQTMVGWACGCVQRVGCICIGICVYIMFY